MNVHIAITENGVRLALSGELTIYTVTEVKTVLADAMKEANEIEVDLSGITDIDTAGLQLMLIAKRNPQKDVCFVNHPPAVLRLIELANLGGALGDSNGPSVIESKEAHHE